MLAIYSAGSFLTSSDLCHSTSHTLCPLSVQYWALLQVSIQQLLKLACSHSWLKAKAKWADVACSRSPAHQTQCLLWSSNTPSKPYDQLSKFSCLPTLTHFPTPSPWLMVPQLNINIIFLALTKPTCPISNKVTSPYLLLFRNILIFSFHRDIKVIQFSALKLLKTS